MTEKHYAQRDIVDQGQFYADHVIAMTSEGLHAKSDIAAELAHRDIEIARLRALLAQWEKNCTGRHGSQMPCGPLRPYSPSTRRYNP